MKGTPVANPHKMPGLDSGLGEKLREMLQRVSLEDLISARYHSRDFTSSRSEYISVRVRTLAFLFAVLAPLWIPIDALVLEGSAFWGIVTMRLVFTALLVTLGAWGGRCTVLATARTRVALFIAIPGLFYLGSRMLFGDGLPETGVLAGYSFLPFLMVALLGVVPLTFIEGGALVALNGAFFIAGELWLGTLFSIPTFGDLWLLALLGLIAIWVQMTQLHMLMRLYREATRDALTGLVNRRVLFRWLDQEVARMRREGKPLCVILFDLDLFKRINDNHGHLSGDAVLHAFGQLLRRELAVTELVGRYGGEEFMAILPGVGIEEARQAAERVRTGCHEVQVANPDRGELISFTTSSGVAALRPDESGEALLARVDQSLYFAKESGRDFVAVAE